MRCLIRSFTFTLFFVLFIGSIRLPAQTFYFVDASVVSSGDGTSWATAKKTINEAEDLPLQPGNVVLIKPGTYIEALGIDKNGEVTIPAVSGVSISDQSTIQFPAGTDMSGIDLINHPNEYYVYVVRSFASNNGVYQVTAVNDAADQVQVLGASFRSESGSAGDFMQLSAAVIRPIIFKNASANPFEEPVILDVNSLPDEYTVLYIGGYVDPYHAFPANGIMVEGLTLTGSSLGGGVHIQCSDYAVIKNCAINDMEGVGILTDGTNDNPTLYTMLIGNKIENTPYEGIYIGAGGHNIGYNKTYFTHVIGNDISVSGNAPNAQLENAVDVKEYNYGTVIERNYFHDFELVSNSNGVVDIRNQADSTVVYNNIVHNITCPANDTYTIFYFYDDINDVYFFNNIVYNDASLSPDIWAFSVTGNAAGGVHVFNNTFHHFAKGLLLQYYTPNGTGADLNVNIFNNIFSDISETPIEEWTWNGAGSGHFNVNNNLWTSDPGSSDYPVPPAFIGDPIFVNASGGDFHIVSASSPASNTGIPIPEHVLYDFEHTLRSTPPDLGAFEAGAPLDFQDALPAGFELSQNFPNPFNPETAIRFSLPEQGNVTVTVTNVLCEEIALLFNGTCTSGNHSVRWDASAFPSGVYFYTLRAELESGKVVTVYKKMLLLK